jgi:hypothetical protein
MQRTSELRDHGLKALLVAAGLLAALCAAEGQPTATAAAPPCPAADAARQSAAVAQSDVWLHLNLPAFTLEVRRGDAVVRRYPVAVGGDEFPTPTGDFTVTRVVWNPWWYPPDSPWARNEPVMAPGPKNPMGKVKLQLRGPYFLHGTPWPESVGGAESHGCVRLRQEDAVALATLVIAAAGPAMARETVDSLLDGPLARTTREVELHTPVLLRIVYELAAVRGDSLHVYPDVYRRVARPRRSVAMEALAGAGIDTAAVRREALDALVSRSRGRAASAPLDSLIAAPSDPSRTLDPRRLP